ncbi:hypothetical protein KO527_22010 [Pseudoalteromonas sp. C2R02]|uniref:hypothetical protein n=1 Tax=Pseudoalteromonas sp. C2R02 TaxID=2841565 RepID=UPI001C09F3D3|nr:hypothetical protein [Pseudoalteromonas sp. C2R02]MBU2972016.1 hypothetical protein [Pseudoalteromonas sp. C2R02]
MDIYKENEYIWNKFAEIERLINSSKADLEAQILKTATDAQKEANFSSRKVTEYKNKSLKAKDIAEASLENIVSLEEKIKLIETQLINFESEVKSRVNNFKSEIEKDRDIASDSASDAQIILQRIHKLSTESQGLYEVLKELPERYDELEGQLESLQENRDESESNVAKIKSQLKAAQQERKEINEVYFELFGYVFEDDDGNEQKVEGKIKELNSSYLTIKSDFETHLEEIKGFRTEQTSLFAEKINILKEGVEQFKETSMTEIASFISDTKDEVAALIEDKSANIEAVELKINTLLPNALTAGLSYAYEEKKKEEELNYTNLSKHFSKCITALVCISLIPVIFNLVMLFKGTAFSEVLKQAPQLFLSIFPLYLPVLWLAFSDNKKMNLSKRLIEEYTHKEVLSKTYEGLSTQINSIEDENTSAELKTKLLFNILEISSENPGKLISNYDKSDHPLMEALDRSSQLTDSIERLAKIPGFQKMAQKLSEKSDALSKAQDARVSDGLDINDEIIMSDTQSDKKSKSEQEPAIIN